MERQEKEGKDCPLQTFDFFFSLAGVSLTPTASFRAHHSAPIAHLSLSPRSGLVYSAASGADFTVRAWDLNALSCVRVVRGLPARPTAVRTFSAASSSGEEEREFFAVGSVEGQMSVGSSSAAVAGLSHFRCVSCSTALADIS